MDVNFVEGRIARARRSGEPADSGVSMIDLAVSMAVMSIAMSLFTAGILSIYRAVKKTESLSTAQSQVATAFQRIDRDLRYAWAISTQGIVGQDHYIEYEMIKSSVPTCVEMRLSASAGQLQRRHWPMGVTPVTPTAWVPLVSMVVPAAVSGANLATQRPFTYVPPRGAVSFQSVQIYLRVALGTGDTASLRETRVTLAALNTTRETSSATTCTEGRAIP